ncbi:uncharacterized protein LOC124284365 [Haliotis rubra]|uniref:uncharacterized protein LOC124284365 n=1 Tax=Haliotis rubra TaxID=36100 RepID=UPI001EE53198|nr:uncharacterized protein LOC124284365 [Haliotis rubra]
MAVREAQCSTRDHIIEGRPSSQCAKPSALRLVLRSLSGKLAKTSVDFNHRFRVFSLQRCPGKRKFSSAVAGRATQSGVRDNKVSVLPLSDILIHQFNQLFSTIAVQEMHCGTKHGSHSSLTSPMNPQIPPCLEEVIDSDGCSADEFFGFISLTIHQYHPDNNEDEFVDDILRYQQYLTLKRSLM